ncbi:hypothetical protein [Yinghuangia soli]|uniref:Uncharacterized protein n=1 Tax=Yinghuangia soli TaxID=2908204 RepID=A0AA41U5C7_9ACTN|nr:hypothetical protein [Yinghuangia soli]MCF2531782.1 hypothetical protein [Yinghuangia soli]
MHAITFEKGRDESGLRVYRHLPGENVAVTRNWAGLYEAWPDADTTPSPWPINNAVPEELAVYAGLAWRLTDGFARYAIPGYYRDEAQRLLQREPVFVDWEYEVDATGLTAETRDKGFVPARAMVRIRPKPTPWEREHAKHAGLFVLDSPRDLLSALRAVHGDASGAVTIFAVAPGAERFTRLVEALRGPECPRLADVLGEDGLLVDVTFGEDLGNYHSLTVASATDLGGTLDTLAAEYTRRVEAYEARVDEIADMAGFRRAMAQLSGIDPDAA